MLNFNSSIHQIEKINIRKFCKLNPFLCGMHIISVWGLIFLVISISTFWFPLGASLLSFFVYLLVAFIISTRQVALLVLTHDGIHFRIAKSKKVNDLVTRVFLAFPTFISLAKWRFLHYHHHRYTYTNEDRDVAIFGRYPMKKKSLIFLLIKDFLGFNVLRNLKYFTDIPLVTKSFNERFMGKENVKKYRKNSDMNQFFIFWIVFLVFMGTLGGWDFFKVFLLYWIIPYCTFTQIFIRIRGAIEHANVPDKKNPYRQTRTYLLNPFWAFILAPKNVNYHLEHHLYPSVPFYHLPALHQTLKKGYYHDKNPYIEPFQKSLKKLFR